MDPGLDTDLPDQQWHFKRRHHPHETIALLPIASDGQPPEEQRSGDEQGASAKGGQKCWFRTAAHRAAVRETVLESLVRVGTRGGLSSPTPRRRLRRRHASG